MSLVQLNELRQKITFIEKFKGYNHTLRADMIDSYDRAEFYDMKSMSLDDYPTIRTRKGETELFRYPGTPTQIWQYKEDTYLVISGGQIYKNVTKESKGTLVTDSGSYITAGRKYFAQIGSKTVIMPDKVTYDMETDTFEKIEKNYNSKNFDGPLFALLKITPCTIDGTPISYTESATAPTDTTKYWYDTTEVCFKKYSDSSEKWVKVTMSYMKLTPVLSSSPTAYKEASVIPSGSTAPGYVHEISKLFGSFLALDTVSIGFSTDTTVIYGAETETADNLIYGTVKGSNTESGTCADGEMNSIILNGVTKSTIAGFTVKIRCPDLTHICSNNNRVWGVSNDTHEIFACKLGDVTQWYNYAGIAGDSYALSLGSPDEITGCASYSNYVVFFTETKIMKIYGDYPSNYQLSTVRASGVRKGADGTLVQISGALFYVSDLGVMVYDGSYPSVISEKLGTDYLRDKDVAAGKHGAKYCLSVSESGKPFGMFVYDTSNGMWVKGSERIISNASQMNSCLCFITDDGRLVTLNEYTRVKDSIAVTGENLVLMDEREEVVI